MNKFWKKIESSGHGAISVFLAIILVPSIIVASVFVDVSRVELSKAQASSAADLALDSLMSHFDEKLNEYYGFVSSVQNIEEFYDKTEEFFKGMMEDVNVSESAQKTLVDFYKNLRNSGGVNFLKTDQL